jgi:hypothetical protein
VDRGRAAEFIVRQQWLSPADLKLVRNKRGEDNRLGFAILLLHFRTHGRFLRAESELDPELFADVMAQLGIASTLLLLMVTDRTADRGVQWQRTYFQSLTHTAAT